MIPEVIVMNETRWIYVLDQGGSRIGLEKIADLETFRFYEWLLKKGKADYPNYTVHFRGEDGENYYFILSDIVPTSQPLGASVDFSSVDPAIVHALGRKPPEDKKFMVTVREYTRFPPSLIATAPG